MEKLLQLWQRKADLLADYLDATQKIADELGREKADERLPEIEQRVEQRAVIIQGVSAVSREIAGEGGGALSPQDNQKQEWLCGELLKQIQAVEDNNAKILNDMMQDYRRKMDKTQKSISTVNAYSQQMQGSESVSGGALFDRTK